jgi:hypothetical protein
VKNKGDRGSRPETPTRGMIGKTVLELYLPAYYKNLTIVSGRR